MLNILRISKLCKENVLSALNELSCNLHLSADCCLPERHVKYVMKSEWDKRTLDKSENKRSDISASCYETTESEDSLLNEWPEIEAEDSHTDICKC